MIGPILPSTPPASDPRPTPVTQKHVDDAKAEFDRVLRTPRGIRKLKAAAAGTTNKINESSDRVTEMFRLQVELEADRIRREAEGKVD